MLYILKINQVHLNSFQLCDALFKGLGVWILGILHMMDPIWGKKGRRNKSAGA